MRRLDIDDVRERERERERQRERERAAMPVPEACDSAEQRGRMSSADDPGQRESSSSSTRTSAVPSKPKATTSIQAAAQQTYDGLSFSKVK